MNALSPKDVLNPVTVFVPEILDKINLILKKNLEFYEEGIVSCLFDYEIDEIIKNNSYRKSDKDLLVSIIIKLYQDKGWDVKFKEKIFKSHYIFRYTK